MTTIQEEVICIYISSKDVRWKEDESYMETSCQINTKKLKRKSFKEYRFESSIIFIFNNGHEKDKNHQWITHQCFDFDW